MNLDWFHFGWNTPLADIGWTWVVLVGLVGWVFYLSYVLWRNW